MGGESDSAVCVCVCGVVCVYVCEKVGGGGGEAGGKRVCVVSVCVWLLEWRGTN